MHTYLAHSAFDRRLSMTSSTVPAISRCEEDLLLRKPGVRHFFFQAPAEDSSKLKWMFFLLAAWKLVALVPG